MPAVHPPSPAWAHCPSPSRWRHSALLSPLLVALLTLSACGGGNSGGGGPVITKPQSEAEAARFLVQSTFGPTPADVNQVMTQGFEPWIDAQLTTPLGISHVGLARVSQQVSQAKNIGNTEVVQSWWTHAVTDPAQLRQRVAFALSEIFVVSSMDGTLSGNGLLLASYMDMLTDGIDGSHRQLLENVALHPAMGIYLSHRGNRKEDPKSGRIPDQNFAREVMQLFSIGLYQLNADGTQKLLNNKPIETYTPEDVRGLSKVFTGFSWSVPPGKEGLSWDKCFFRNSACQDESQLTSPMRAYFDPKVPLTSDANPHDSGPKTAPSLGLSLPARLDPMADLRDALDALERHENTAPFFCKQLIQRLVTSNPSPTYVADVVGVYKANGGAIKPVVKAILMHTEARQLGGQDIARYGKLREPLLRMTHLLRALPHRSDNAASASAAGLAPYYLFGETDNAGTSLGQTPLRAPSVFNFFRPGYVPAQTQLGQEGRVAPELQTTSETSVIGYANLMADVLNNGTGSGNSFTKKRDVQFDYSSLDALAATPAALIDRASKLLLNRDTAPEPLRTTAINVIDKMANKNANDRKLRIQAALLLVTVSPEFTVQQ
ncbi:MAG: hypothetical protein RJB60_491 [Pseudomonadota bacterium]